MTDEDSQQNPSRRTVIKSATVGASSVALMNSAGADDHGGNEEKEDDMYRDEDDAWGKGADCGYNNPSSGVGFLFPSHHDICAADHPEALKLKDACGYTLDHVLPDVGTLIARGAIPYFDILSVGGFSHWLFPEHINDYSLSLDPGRPETILINNDNYCAQGIMFIPPHEQKARESPLYVTGNPDEYNHEYAYVKRRRKYDESTDEYFTYGNADFRNSEEQGFWDDYERTDFDPEQWEDDGTICAPWHYHTDGFARFAWWYNRQVHQAALVEDQEAQFWCHVPGMFHVWPGAEDGDISTFEHDPPNSYRTGPEPCRSGYPAPYIPEDGSPLTLEDLPDWLQRKAMPEDLERELRILGDYDDETIYQMPVGEIMSLVGFDPDVPDSNVT
jgi:hypothetical protein